MKNFTEVLKQAKLLAEELEKYAAEKIKEDENMDVEKTKLPNLDHIFGDSPVNDYVNAHIDYLQAEDSAASEAAYKRAQEATKKLAEAQQVVPSIYIDGNEIRFGNTKVEKVQTLDEFAEEFAEAINVLEGDYRADFNLNLVEAIHVIEERYGYVTFHVQTTDGNKKGKMSISDNVVTLELEDALFSYNLAQPEPEEEEDEDYYPFHAEEGPLPCGCMSVKDCKYAEEDEEADDIESPEDFVANLSEDIEDLKWANMEVIESYLLGVKGLTKEQLELVRYYLKQLPDNSSNGIDALSDHAVELAWKRVSYLK